MSRSGYTDYCEGWALIRWRGAVASAIRGKRGQAFLREALAALESIPDKRLIAGELINAEGGFCTLGAVGKCRGTDLAAIDYEDRQSVANAFGIPEALAAEIMYENDESADEEELVYVEICGPVRPGYPEWGSHEKRIYRKRQMVEERRWAAMHQWIISNMAGAATR